MLNWQIGKSYRRRDGSIVAVKQIVDKKHEPESYIEFYTGPAVFKHNGQVYMFKESQNDIIEEFVEEKMKIEVGKWYKTRDGHKAFVGFEYKSRNGFTHMGFVQDHTPVDDYDTTLGWYSDGRHMRNEECMYDLIEECKAPKSGVGYVNVYSDNWMAPFHPTREVADKEAINRMERLACVRVEWKEGQFDD